MKTGVPRGTVGSNPTLVANAGIAQLAEQGFCKAQVMGSSPFTSFQKINLGLDKSK